ncbi:MAG: DUF4105 domain-containing protein [Sphingobacteriales bacterium]|nr:MAG: DUF4105 domain-containing protein [Sphingobacteriales bacterium]
MTSKKIQFLFLIFIFQYVALFGQQDRIFEVPKLSNQAQVSLLTIGLGTETYQLFGHTAIRVKDNKLGWDFVYNYGTFDFSDPDFLIKFIKGKLLYYESIDTYSEFVQGYREQNRSIHEQVLDLDSIQKQKAFEFLTINARDENKYYKYDFLFDNCATRPRDILLKVVYKQQVKFEDDVDDKSTYRALIDRHNTNEWLDFGMDLLIGLPTDTESGFGRTFIPYELMQLIDGATLNGKKIVKQTNEILDTVPEYKKVSWITPSLIFWLLFIILLILSTKTQFNLKPIGIIYFSILGLLGWLLIFMWFGTDHLSTKWNLNILWTMPLNLPLALLLIKKEKSKFVLNYIKFYRILLILLLVFWFINPQQYHIAVLPLIFIGILLASKFIPVPIRKT